MLNCRISGVVGTTGNRRGISGISFGTPQVCESVTVEGVGGVGMFDASTQANTDTFRIKDCSIINCGSDGIKLRSTASQTAVHLVQNSLITGCGGWGIDSQSVAYCRATNNRLRDNASGDVSVLANYETAWNYTTDPYASQAIADADEFVDSANGDFRIKSGSPIWGMGYGVGDQPAGGMRRSRPMNGGITS